MLSWIPSCGSTCCGGKARVGESPLGGDDLEVSSRLVFPTVGRKHDTLALPHIALHHEFLYVLVIIFFVSERMPPQDVFCFHRLSSPRFRWPDRHRPVAGDARWMPKPRFFGQAETWVAAETVATTRDAEVGAAEGSSL